MIIVAPMTAKLTASLRAAPATVPCLAAIALCVVWATDQAGYPVTHWAPGGLIVLALLAIAAVAVGPPLARAPAPVRVAVACLAAYTALSYLSILWAADPGEAFEGADRTLLYLLVFALFASWPPDRRDGRRAAAGLDALDRAGSRCSFCCTSTARLRPALPSLLPGGRLTFPSGYANANAAEWLMAFWPALLMARERRLPWALRGLLAGAAVLLAGVTLLSQSRGSLYATPAMLILVFALLPRRTRTFAVLVPVAGGIAAATPAVLRVGDHLREGQVVGDDPAPRDRRHPARGARRRAARRRRRRAGVPPHALGRRRAARAPRDGRGRGRGAARASSPSASSSPAIPSSASNTPGTASRAATAKAAATACSAASAPTATTSTAWPSTNSARIPSPASAPTTSSSSTCARARAKRRRATRTASSCARSRRPA